MKKRIRYASHGSDEWVEIGENWRLKCCDCGLVHDFEFRIVYNKIHLRAKRNNKATNAGRKCNICGSKQVLDILNLCDKCLLKDKKFITIYSKKGDGK